MIDKIMSQEELDLANSRSEEAERLLEAASLQLMRYKPYYGTMLAAMPIVKATESINTMATDGRSILYSPEFVAGMTEERKDIVKKRIDHLVSDKKKSGELKDMIDVFYKRKTAREVTLVLEHECDHVVSEHIHRGKGFDHALFNIAADHRINTTAVLAHTQGGEMGSAWFPKGSSTVFEPTEEFGFMKWGYCDFRFKDMFTEQIYEVLKKEENPDGGKKGTDQHMGGDGTLGEEGDELTEAMGTDPSSVKPLTQEQKNYNDTVMRRAIENAVQAAGSGAPVDARKFVEEAGKPKINYLRLLRKTIERLFKTNVTYRRLNRRSYSLTKTLRQSGRLSSRQTVGLPSNTKEKTIRVHIGFDVSGSFNDSLLAPTIREIKGLCGQYDDFEVTLFCWSTEVGEVKSYDKRNIRDINNYKIKTTGGTDVSCVFEHLDKEVNEPDQVVIYTDGFFSDISGVKDWSKKYGKKTLWVLLGRQSMEWEPPFGKAVDFDKYL